MIEFQVFFMYLYFFGWFFPKNPSTSSKNPFNNPSKSPKIHQNPSKSKKQRKHPSKTSRLLTIFSPSPDGEACLPCPAGHAWWPSCESIDLQDGRPGT